MRRSCSIKDALSIEAEGEAVIGDIMKHSRSGIHIACPPNLHHIPEKIFPKYIGSGVAAVPAA